MSESPRAVECRVFLVIYISRDMRDFARFVFYIARITALQAREVYEKKRPMRRNFFISRICAWVIFLAQ